MGKFLSAFFCRAFSREFRRRIYIRWTIALAALAFPGICAAMGCMIYCPDGSRPHVDCDATGDPCSGSSTGSSPSTYDYEAARRAQEAAAAAAAAAAAELRRQEEEADRIEKERLAEKRRQQEAKDAEFIRNRDKTVLKGSIGTLVSPNDGKLKGSSQVNTGLNEMRPGDRPVEVSSGQRAAWKQLHCAASLSGYAFAAVRQEKPDFQESSFLLEQASNAMNGRTINVECPAAPPFPDLRGRAVDMTRVSEAERKIVDRAVVLVARMKQRDVPVAGAAAATSAGSAGGIAETPEDKARRIQRELNQVNSRKITGKTKAEIDAQERDRKELASLVLANEKLEKGELTSVTVDNREETPASRTRRRPAAVTQ